MRDGGNHFQPEFPAGARGENCDYATNGTRAGFGLDANESRDLAKDGVEHAFYRIDGAAGPGIRQLDDAGFAEQSEVAPARSADLAGSGGGECVFGRTRSAAVRTRQFHRVRSGEDRQFSLRCQGAVKSHARQRAKGDWRADDKSSEGFEEPGEITWTDSRFTAGKN